ncbi:MAG: rRNA maturation RNase YbeY [Eubacteriaceae bacterium]
MELHIDNRSKIDLSENLVVKIKECINECIKVEKFYDNCEISLSFVENNEIRQLNKSYRNKDCATDVLSFPMYEESETRIENEILLGDIVMSISKAAEQATEYGHTVEREICYLIIHGMFHLLGYDHMQDDEKKLMREKEKKVIKNINL